MEWTGKSQVEDNSGTYHYLFFKCRLKIEQINKYIEINKYLLQCKLALWNVIYCSKHSGHIMQIKKLSMSTANSMTQTNKHSNKEKPKNIC